MPMPRSGMNSRPLADSNIKIESTEWIGGGIEDNDIFAYFFDAGPGDLYVIAAVEEDEAAGGLGNQQCFDLSGGGIEEQLRVGELSVAAAIGQIDDFFITDIAQSHIGNPFLVSAGEGREQ